MKDIKYDLAISYRIYPNISDRAKPPIFKDNKYNLSELCLKSFKRSLGNLKVKIWAILDNCPEKYERLFKKYFNEEELTIIKKAKMGNNATFGLQIKILLKQSDSDFVYFAEDDYYYFANQFSNMISFLKENSDVDFITPYDHPAYYTDALHKHKQKIKSYKQKIWKTSCCSCLTFLTSKSTLQKTKKILQFYAKGKLKDRSIWLCLTKYWVFRPLKILKFYFNNHNIFLDIVTALKYGWKYIFFGKRLNLWYPFPTIGTHMVEEFLSPKIDWKSIFLKEIENLKS